MIPPDEAADSGRLAPLSTAWKWAILVLLSVPTALLFEWLGFPAGFLVGPMIAGVLVAVGGGSVTVPLSVSTCAQSIVGCLVAASFSPETIPAFAGAWPQLLAAVFATLAGSSLLGWLISRYRVLPGTVGVWGSAPGAATAMVLMAGAFGADQRLVAFMQYFRVIVVTAVATVIARLWLDIEGGSAPGIDLFEPIDPLPFVAMLAIAVAGPVLGRLVRLPTPNFVGPIVLGLGFQFSGIAQFQLPEWLLAASFAVIGWTVGLRFTRQTLSQTRAALPHVAAGVVALILFCGLIAFVLAEFAGVDPLTAYLATSPGGMDAIAIIAAGSTNVDISFIMASQMLRFLIVLAIGPWLARRVAALVGENAGT